MALEVYQKKRKFSQTPEPPGQAKTKSASHFVIQKHRATALHFDFRLELPDNIFKSQAHPLKFARGERRRVVLKSWAVPKNLPPKAGVKRLAVQTEDHPVDYLNFQGIIPQGNYGAGKVEIWDKGKFKLIEAKPRSLKFELKGKKLKGNYVLFNLPGKNWLIFKIRN